jgi:hypothetical protein
VPVPRGSGPLIIMGTALDMYYYSTYMYGHTYKAENHAAIPSAQHGYIFPHHYTFYLYFLPFAFNFLTADNEE